MDAPLYAVQTSVRVSRAVCLLLERPIKASEASQYPVGRIAQVDASLTDGPLRDAFRGPKKMFRNQIIALGEVSTRISTDFRVSDIDEPFYVPHGYSPDHVWRSKTLLEKSDRLP